VALVNVAMTIWNHMRTLIELHQSSHTDEWESRHINGDVPDRRPYGLHKLALHGIEPVWPDRLHGWRASCGRVVAKLTGLRCVEAWQASVNGIGARLCWDERLGIPAALDLRTRSLPVVSGVIWATDRKGQGRTRTLLRSAFWSRQHTLFVLSRGQARKLQMLTKAIVEYVPFGVDADFWRPGETPDPDARLVASAGNDRHRDFGTLIRGVLADHRSRLTVATSAALPKAERLSAGPRSHGELRRLYQAANVVAVSTIYNDHCSGITTILEAMACGRPVVATSTPGADAYIEHGVTGFLVPPGDVHALTRATGLLLDDPERANAMGAAAAKLVCTQFTTGHMAAHLARLVHQAKVR
jgi:glycosyltransferase involved in cell wall biosynthesis